MEKGMTFCEECRTDVTYSVETFPTKKTLKEKEYRYIHKKARCEKCGLDVYVPEVIDYNLKALYDAYRQKNDIISLEKILEIPEKYKIGKRPLSLLLGWGEMTFTRYCDGDMPSKQYSDVLQNVYNRPDFYLSILEKNKDNVTQVAYDKSKSATLELLVSQKDGTSKVDQVIGYLLFHCEDITPLALQKILYYIQGFYYAFTNEFLFNEDCEAWVHGPVYRDIYYRYADYRFNPIEGHAQPAPNDFTDSELAVIDSVIRNFCCYSGKTLEQFTHSETPWLRTRDNLPAGSPSNRIIQKELIGEYFSAVKQKYAMLKPNDIGSYAKDLFLGSQKE